MGCRAAVCDSIDALRDEINARIESALDKLDDTAAAAVAMVTRFNFGELDELGDLLECNQQVLLTSLDLGGRVRRTARSSTRRASSLLLCVSS